MIPIVEPHGSTYVMEDAASEVVTIHIAGRIRTSDLPVMSPTSDIMQTRHCVCSRKRADYIP